MNEMIDRLARKLSQDAKRWNYDLPLPLCQILARGLLQAMREPTDEMCEAGYSAGTGDWGGRYDNRRELARGRIQPSWNAMIDAALPAPPVEQAKTEVEG